MPHEYTRQRQGRDFPARETNKSLLTLLEQYKQEAERNAAPVDGNEPTRETGGDGHER